MFRKVRLFFAVFKSPCQGTSSVLTVMRIGHCLLNYFSSLFNSFTTSPVVLSLQFCATSVTTKTFLSCSVHAFEAGLKAGWVDGGTARREAEWLRSHGLFFLCPVPRPGKDEIPTGVSMAWASGSQRSGITSAVWICVSIPTRSASTWTWLLLLKFAQRIPWSPVFILSFHVPPCARLLLDLTRRKYKVQRVCRSCPTANPISSALALLLCLYSTLRDVGNHHSARVFHREETRL